jgi:hypothetical protein
MTAWLKLSVHFTSDIGDRGMKKVARILLVLVAAAFTLNGAAAEDRVDRNLQIMLEAARNLEWGGGPDLDQRAYILVKSHTVRSPVGIIFGYVDNEAACQQIAKELSDARMPLVDSFECDPVY